jgi:carbon monoxide dehydrogenase subunit G
MSEVITSIKIDAPPEKIWAVVMDPHRLGEWVTIHRKLNDASDGEMDQTLCLRGVNFKVHWELADCEEPTHAVWKGRGPARSHAETEYRLTPVDGGTRFAYRNEFKAPLGPLGAAASRALVGGLPEREAHATLKNLKDLVERG